MFGNSIPPHNYRLLLTLTVIVNVSIAKPLINIGHWNDTINELKLHMTTKYYWYNYLVKKISVELRDLLPVEPDDDCTPKIMGGDKAESHEFPFHVSLTWPPDTRYYCGGVLITPKHVLTAAHCVITDYGWYMEPQHIVVVAGRNSLNETGEIRYTEKITYHENYTIETKQNDIAIIELKEPFELSKKINTIPLINYRVRPLTKCTAIGFGASGPTGPPTTNDLMKVDLPVQSMLRCRLLFAKRVQIFDGMMCAGYVTGKHDACTGDSGGPFVCNNQLGGIVSAGIGCGIFYNPGIYTDVVYFRSFIDGVLAASNITLPQNDSVEPSPTCGEQSSNDKQLTTVSNLEEDTLEISPEFNSIDNNIEIPEKKSQPGIVHVPEGKFSILPIEDVLPTDKDDENVSPIYNKMENIPKVNNKIDLKENFLVTTNIQNDNKSPHSLSTTMGSNIKRIFTSTDFSQNWDFGSTKHLSSWNESLNSTNTNNDQDILTNDDSNNIDYVDPEDLATPKDVSEVALTLKYDQNTNSNNLDSSSNVYQDIFSTDRSGAFESGNPDDLVTSKEAFDVTSKLENTQNTDSNNLDSSSNVYKDSVSTDGSSSLGSGSPNDLVTSKEAFDVTSKLENTQNTDSNNLDSSSNVYKDSVSTDGISNLRSGNRDDLVISKEGFDVTSKLENTQNTDWSNFDSPTVIFSTNVYQNVESANLDSEDPKDLTTLKEIKSQNMLTTISIPHKNTYVDNVLIYDRNHVTNNFDSNEIFTLVTTNENPKRIKSKENNRKYRPENNSHREMVSKIIIFLMVFKNLLFVLPHF